MNKKEAVAYAQVALDYMQNRFFTPILHGFSQPDAGAGAV